MFRILADEHNLKFESTFRDLFFRSLINPGPKLVIIAKGHILKKEKTASSSKVFHRSVVRQRDSLSGTPLQNNLEYYYFMGQFVQPNVLGTQRKFKNRFVTPAMDWCFFLFWNAFSKVLVSSNGKTANKWNSFYRKKTQVHWFRKHVSNGDQDLDHINDGFQTRRSNRRGWVGVGLSII